MKRIKSKLMSQWTVSQKFEFLAFAKVDITTSGQCSTLITISVLTGNPQMLLPVLNRNHYHRCLTLNTIFSDPWPIDSFKS